MRPSNRSKRSSLRNSRSYTQPIFDADIANQASKNLKFQSKDKIIDNYTMKLVEAERKNIEKRAAIHAQQKELELANRARDIVTHWKSHEQESRGNSVAMETVSHILPQPKDQISVKQPLYNPKKDDITSLIHGGMIYEPRQNLPKPFTQETRDTFSQHHSDAHSQQHIMEHINRNICKVNDDHAHRTNENNLSAMKQLKEIENLNELNSNLYRIPPSRGHQNIPASSTSNPQRKEGQYHRNVQDDINNKQKRMSVSGSMNREWSTDRTKSLDGRESTFSKSIDGASDLTLANDPRNNSRNRNQYNSTTSFNGIENPNVILPLNNDEEADQIYNNVGHTPATIGRDIASIVSYFNTLVQKEKEDHNRRVQQEETRFKLRMKELREEMKKALNECQIE